MSSRFLNMRYEDVTNVTTFFVKFNRAIVPRVLKKLFRFLVEVVDKNSLNHRY